MSKRAKQLLGGVIIGLALIGTWVYWQRPTRVATAALTQVAEAETGTFTAVLQLENAQATTEVLGEAGTVVLTLDGDFKRSETGRDALQANFEVATKTDTVSVNIVGEARFVDDTAYLFVKDAPPLFGILNRLEGQWLALPRGEAPAASPATSTETLISDVRRVRSEEIDGSAVTVYTATAKEEAVVRLMDQIAQLLGTSLTTEQIANIRQGLGEVTSVPVEIKVDRWGKAMRQLVTTLTVPGGNKAQFTLTMHAINPTVNITAPEGAQPINEAVAKVVQEARAAQSP